MRSGLLALAVAVPVSLLGCGPASAGKSGDDTIEPGKAFTLAPGDTARLKDGDLTVTLKGVPQDSRCPQGVQCVWEGDVTVDVDTVSGGKTTSHKLNLNREPTHVVVAGHDLKLVAVKPGRVHEQPISGSDYRADFTLTGK